MTHEVLGFDFRVRPESQGTRWTKERRETYLLRADIQFPVSADRTVWPECTTRLQKSQTAEMEAQSNGPLNGLDLFTENKGPDSLAAYRHDSAVLIALTSDKTTVAHLRQMHSVGPSSFAVAELEDSGWSFWGYDVADAWMTSGLMNCGFASDEKAGYVERYSTGLNGWGLFDDIKISNVYSDETNARVSEHAPFYVFGILVAGIR